MKSQMQKIRLGATRESQRKQGFFDGRFVERSIPSDKVYTRKTKHKNKEL
jgi:hypothetical protein